MRMHLIVLSAFGGLLLSGPGYAQTEVNCPTAAQALSTSAHAGKILDLRVTYDEMATVNEINQDAVGSNYIGYADNIQVFYIEPGNYMLMASVQGCHVAHVFVDDAALAIVTALFAPTPDRIMVSRAS